jgi:hypothetical protein
VTVSAASGPLAAATTDPAVAAELAATVSTSSCGDAGSANELAAAEAAGLFLPAINAEGWVEAVLQVTHPAGPAGQLTGEDGVVARVLARHLGVALQNYSLRGGGGGGDGGLGGCLAEVLSQRYEEAIRRIVATCRARLGAEHVEVLLIALLPSSCIIPDKLIVDDQKIGRTFLSCFMFSHTSATSQVAVCSCG